jgi:chromosome segregation ATPase
MANINWGVVSNAVIFLGGFLGILAYFNAEYAGANEFNSVKGAVEIHSNKIPVLETQQAGMVEQIQQFQIDSKRDRLEEQITNTEDKIYELKRQMDRNPSAVTNEDRRRLERLERRLERYEGQLEALKTNSI